MAFEQSTERVAYLFKTYLSPGVNPFAADTRAIL